MQLTVPSLRAALFAHRPVPLAGHRFAAVAMILRERKNELELLVIERSRHDRDPWSGHLAFPGGKQEHGDESLQATAERETLEELGLDLRTHADALGGLDHLAARGPRSSGLVVAPFVYLTRTAPVLVPHVREVQDHFWVPLAPLAKGERNTSINVEHEARLFRMPGFDVEGRVLWGMSYQMLRSLLELLAID